MTDAPQPPTEGTTASRSMFSPASSSIAAETAVSLAAHGRASKLVNRREPEAEPNGAVAAPATDAESAPLPRGFAAADPEHSAIDSGKVENEHADEDEDTPRSEKSFAPLSHASLMDHYMNRHLIMSTDTELFRLADQSSLQTSMRSGYVECAKCKRFLLDTVQLDGRCEVKVLPCFHCICAACLQGALSGCIGEAISCPLCARHCKRMQLHEFLPHFDVHSLHDGEQIAKQGLMCEECVSANRAETYCPSCVMNLCGACSTQHKRSKATACHQLMGLSDDPPEKGMVVRHRALYCATHRTSCYKLFCEDCDMIICYECAVDGHQNHSYKLPTEGLVNRQRQRIQEVLDKLGQQLGEAHKLQRCVHDGLAALGTEAAKASNEVNAAFDALSAIASSRGKELLQPLQKEYGEWREQLLAERSVCSRALVDIWRTIDFLEKVLARGTDVEVLQVK
eukprot:CAMPEP_0117478606 /NCGR_PEP_ID=MMETSP0784-20121206/11449_1 /TAXON_ID=39447 /ORGANISM="" /LENGTH=452 /DNA_ID=CAMNT_0005272993 /DNA_START=36 /DNA_END=1391 /DNA_ORIENTATION=+